MGIKPAVIRAPQANMFLSPVFKQTLSNTADVKIELYDTDGAQGAARGAAYGAGFYNSFSEAFVSLKKIESISPVKKDLDKTDTAYHLWLSRLVQFL
jgi:xylulokinase